MRAHWFGASTSAVALFAALTAVQAQDVSGRGTAAYGTPPAVSGSAGVDVGGVQTRAVLTPEEQTAQANEITRSANALAERLSKMLDEARREKDVLRANCVNRKLTEVNANARNIEQRRNALANAVASGDEARRGHEYTVLTVLAQKITSLNQEASQCLGQSVYEPGASQVITTITTTGSLTDPSDTGSIPAPPPTFTVAPASTTGV